MRDVVVVLAPEAWPKLRQSYASNDREELEEESDLKTHSFTYHYSLATKYQATD